jgi:RNA polymerase sigma-70 factor (ECF subfamily)
MAATHHGQHVHQRLPEKARRTDVCHPDSIGSQLLRAESHHGSAEDLMVGRLLNSDLTAALRALPHRHRMVVYLADLQGLGYRQISALTGIPLGSVKSCLHRARNRLRAELGAYASQG